MGVRAALQVFWLCVYVCCVFLCLGGAQGGEDKKGRGPAHCMLGTNGHVHGSAYVRACLWVADGRGKKAVVSGGVCVQVHARLCRCTCSAYVFCAYVVAINYVCLEHVHVCQHGCAAVQVFGRACILVFSVVCASLFLGGRGGEEKGEGRRIVCWGQTAMCL